MNKTLLSLSYDALFRYRIVSAVRAHIKMGRPLQDAVRLESDKVHLESDQTFQTVSKRSIYRWVNLYGEHGLAGLENKLRSKCEDSTVLSPDLLAFLIDERELDPYASIPEFIRRARAKGLIRPDEKVCRTSVWRAFQRMGLLTARRKRPQIHDMRRFAYPERMQMVMVDYKHFKAGASYAKRVAIYFLDNASRFGLDVRVTTSEQSEVFLHGLHAVLRRFGLMDILYTDQGSAFTANDAARVIAQLELCSIFGKARYPEGHGAIERFNRSAAERILNSLAGDPGIDPHPDALTLRLQHDLFEVYNHLPHETLKGQSPFQRWHASERPLRPVLSDDWLIERFTLTTSRKVSNDHVLKYGGGLYEVPRGLAGLKIKLYRRLIPNNLLYILHNGHLVRLSPVDVHLNAVSPRGQRRKTPAEPTPPRKSASTIQFDNTYQPIVDSEGGFTLPDDDSSNSLE